FRHENVDRARGQSKSGPLVEASDKRRTNHHSRGSVCGAVAATSHAAGGARIGTAYVARGIAPTAIPVATHSGSGRSLPFRGTRRAADRRQTEWSMIHLDTNYLIGLAVAGSAQAQHVDQWLTAGE